MSPTTALSVSHAVKELIMTTNETVERYKQLINFTVSRGTLNPHDLADSFWDALVELSDGSVDPVLAEFRDHVIQRGSETELHDLLNDLDDALSELALPGLYFGNHEGDGADFGFHYCLIEDDDAVIHEPAMHPTTLRFCDTLYTGKSVSNIAGCLAAYEKLCKEENFTPTLYHINERGCVGIVLQTGSREWEIV
tara:strand:+ start:1252 stop:1836 length:585 start_codon:yes stop_codon:yes gene_type:complete